MFLKDFLKPNHFFLASVFLFVLFLFRNPFSQRTLIPNFSPSLDAFHYIVPARSFLAGEGFQLTREGRGFGPSVPPLYSIVLIPGFILYNDPRVFYFTNILLSLLSLALFYKIIKKLTLNKWIIGFSLFLYVSNYFLYWYPTLAMAENLLLPLFLVSILLLISKVSRINSIMAGLIGVSFYATKFSAVPLSALYFILYAIKVFCGKLEKQEKILSIVRIVACFFTAFFILFVYEHISQDGRSLVSLLNFISPIFPGIPRPAHSQMHKSSWAFSLSHVASNLPQYLGAIKGKSMKFLWDFTPIVPRWLAITGIFGLVSGLVYKKFRLLSLALILMLFGQIFFISMFYSADARYIYHAIPTLLLGLVLFFVFLFRFLNKRKLGFIFYIFSAGLFVFYGLANLMRIKYQIVLNLKYAETPWDYISILNLNEYFTDDKVRNIKKPIVISALVPYFIDFYSNGNYSLLPLSPDQEFRSKKEFAWGPNDYSDFIALYKSYFDQGYDLYIHNYGLGNEGYMHQAYNEVQNNFTLEKVAGGCYEACNVYKLLKKNNLR